ncbi:protein C3orf33 homolog [Mya arenaria]|uniref:protein C3orf33 homolog n=1 Tax=Mya arenaria TaxID=6604 RepID=UPI0022DF7063|nr:protein C3orf33 homolog [Mya arenaria]
MDDGNRTNGSRRIKKTFIDDFQVFVDRNHRIFTNALYAAGGITVIYMAWKVKATTVFTRVEKIPTDFIQNRVQLLGQVRRIDNDGVLHIQHKPIVKLKVPFTKPKSTDLLPVHLACIDVSLEGHLWLQQNMLERVVWFHLLHRSKEHGEARLHCKVEIPRRFRWNIQVNEELVKMGICKISSLEQLKEIDPASTNQNLLQYIDRLVKLEHQASSKSVGMWTQSEDKVWSKKGLNLVKFVLTGPINIVKYIIRQLRRK